MGRETATRDAIGQMPYRLALAGGWIDQPFVSQRLPTPPGSMVVASLEPTCWFLERAGLATGTRNVARRLWGDELPRRDGGELVRELYEAENRGQREPSGSQDMVGLIYPGISRLDYDFAHEAGVFPRHIESTNDPGIAHWLESTIRLIAVAQRASGYNPLGKQRLDPAWIERLGRTGRDCFDAILATDVRALGAAMNESMACWEAILPQTLRHPAITVDLVGLLAHYQRWYPGAAYSGCGGGYLLIASEQPVPGAMQVAVRLAARGATT